MMLLGWTAVSPPALSLHRYFHNGTNAEQVLLPSENVSLMVGIGLEHAGRLVCAQRSARSLGWVKFGSCDLVKLLSSLERRVLQKRRSYVCPRARGGRGRACCLFAKWRCVNRPFRPTVDTTASVQIDFNYIASPLILCRMHSCMM